MDQHLGNHYHVVLLKYQFTQLFSCNGVNVYWHMIGCDDLNNLLSLVDQIKCQYTFAP